MVACRRGGRVGRRRSRLTYAEKMQENRRNDPFLSRTPRSNVMPIYTQLRIFVKQGEYAFVTSEKSRKPP